MTLQELLADIQQNILPSGIPNNIDAAKIRQAIGNIAGFFNPADGDAVFEGFIRHVIYEGQNLQAFESYFVTPRKSKTGEFALFYDPTFFRGIVLARQVGSGLAPAPAASGSFTLSAAPFDGTVKSQVLNIGALTNDLEYAIKFYRADGIITNPVVRYNGQEVTAASIDFSSGVVVMPFVKILGQDTITLEYDLFASGTANTLNYSVRALKAPAGELSGQYVYHVENGGIGDFTFDLIIEQPGNIPEATPTEFGLVKKSNSLTDSGPDKVLNLDALKTALAGKLSLGTNTLGIATYLFSEFQFDVQLPNARMDFNDGSLDLNFPNSGFQFFDGAFVAALTGKGFAVNNGDGLYYEDIVGSYKRIFQVPSGDGSTDFRFEFRNKSTNALIQSFVFNENGARYTAPYVGSNPLDIVTREWIQQQIGAIGSGAGQGVHVPVQNITNLKAIDTTNATNYPDKWLINVEDSGLYRYDRESTASEALPRVVSPTTGPGRWIRLTTPLTDHALLDFLQGGAPGEYYHLTASEHAAVQGLSTALAGKLAPSDLFKSTGLYSIPASSYIRWQNALISLTLDEDGFNLSQQDGANNRYIDIFVSLFNDLAEFRTFKDLSFQDMAGNLRNILIANPTADQHAVTKGWIEAKLTSEEKLLSATSVNITAEEGNILSRTVTGTENITITNPKPNGIFTILATGGTGLTVNSQTLRGDPYDPSKTNIVDVRCVRTSPALYEVINSAV